MCVFGISRIELNDEQLSCAHYYTDLVYIENCPERHCSNISTLTSTLWTWSKLQQASNRDYLFGYLLYIILVSSVLLEFIVILILLVEFFRYLLLEIYKILEDADKDQFRVVLLHMIELIASNGDLSPLTNDYYKRKALLSESCEVQRCFEVNCHFCRVRNLEILLFCLFILYIGILFWTSGNKFYWAFLKWWLI